MCPSQKFVNCTIMQNSRHTSRYALDPEVKCNAMKAAKQLSPVSCNVAAHCAVCMLVPAAMHDVLDLRLERCAQTHLHRVLMQGRVNISIPSPQTNQYTDLINESHMPAAAGCPDGSCTFHSTTIAPFACRQVSTSRSRYELGNINQGL